MIFQITTAEGVSTAHSLADLPLAALDAVFLAPAGDLIDGSGLAALIQSTLGDGISINADPSISGDQIALAEFTLLASSLRQVLSGAHSASANDFVLGASDDAAPDTAAELEDRAGRLVDQFDNAVSAVQAGGAGLKGALLRLSFFNLPQAIPTSGDADALSAQAAGVLPTAQAALDDAQSQLAAAQADQATVTGSQRVRAAQGVIAVVLGAGFPILPRFSASLTADVLRDETQVGSDDPRAVMGWLLKTARAHPDLLALRDTITAAEALQDRALFPLWVAQMPYVAGEAWAGLARPNADGSDRLSLVLTSNGAKSGAGRRDRRAGAGSVDRAHPVGLRNDRADLPLRRADQPPAAGDAAGAAAGRQKLEL